MNLSENWTGAISLYDVQFKKEAMGQYFEMGTDKFTNRHP